MATSGAQSVKALATPVARLMAPGPEQPMATPGPRHPRPRVGGQGGRLLVARVDGADAELDAGRLRLEHRAAHQ